MCGRCFMMAQAEETVRNAMDLIRLSEDQFVHWAVDSLGFKDRVTPCVNEQYMFEVPIDASTADVCDGFLAQLLMVVSESFAQTGCDFK